MGIKVNELNLSYKMDGKTGENLFTLFYFYINIFR